jgi:hypothetical protein
MQSVDIKDFMQGGHFNITVTRKSQLMDSYEPMEILINGYQAGILKNGETATYRVYGEAAQLQARMAMNRTAPCHVTAGEAEASSFLVESTMTNTIFIIGTILVVISTILVLFTERLSYMLIAAPPALYHLYLRFLRRDTYLFIRETAG